MHRGFSMCQPCQGALGQCRCQLAQHNKVKQKLKAKQSVNVKKCAPSSAPLPMPLFSKTQLLSFQNCPCPLSCLFSNNSRRAIADRNVVSPAHCLPVCCLVHWWHAHAHQRIDIRMFGENAMVNVSKCPPPTITMPPTPRIE